jgi:hypothetical protein
MWRLRRRAQIMAALTAPHTVETFRAKAEEYERMANEADVLMAKLHRTLAEAYRDLADELEGRTNRRNTGLMPRRLRS